VAVALAAARVGQEHRVASGGQPLRAGEPEQLETIGVTVVGASVRDGDERERAVRSGFPDWQYEQTVQIEAVGGTVGQWSLGAECYADLVELLNDPTDPEHQDRLEWLGLDDAADFDPDSFDAETVTQALSRIA
jgi:hypothetical protein